MGILFIVSRGEPDLYGYVRGSFSGEDTVRIILDRRAGERRRRHAEPGADSRRGDRRSRPTIDRDLRAYGWAIVRPQEQSA